MTQTIDYQAVAPPIILALTAGLVLLLDAFLPRRPLVRPGLGLVTLAGVLGALGAVIAQASRAGGSIRTFCVPGGPPGPAMGGPGVPDLVSGGAVRTSPQAIPGPVAGLAGGLSPQPGSGPLPAGAGGAAAGPGVVSCSFVVDHFTLIFAGLALAAGVVVVLLSMTELSSGRIPVGEWYFLLLCTLTGAVVLPASRDLIMLVVALELVSLPVFALTALRRYDGRSTEAAVKLFLVSVVSTAVTLFGVSLLYGTTGTVFLDRLARALGPGPAIPVSSGQGWVAQEAGVSSAAHVLPLQAAHDPSSLNPSPVITVAVVMVIAGFAFKVAAVPFHAWAGDVYQGAPVPVAALLSVVSKATGFAGLILVLTVALRSQAFTWVPLVAVIAALTMTAGNLLALRQRHAVRLLAWSSVAQSGYILAPLGVHDVGAAGASIAYLVFYAAMNLGAFAVVTLVSRRRSRNELDDYRGLAFRAPVAGPALVFFLICLAGLPPGLAGMFAKIVVFRELVSGGGVWLALVMAANTVVGLYYYLAWAARILSPAPAESDVEATAETGGSRTGWVPAGIDRKSVV